jgi:ABC-type amino acid transport substrate-binding protein
MRYTLDRRTLLGQAAMAGPMLALCKSGMGAPRPTTVVTGVLTVAIAGDMPMTNIRNGKLIGTDGEMIAAIAEKLGLEVRPALMDWSATFESVRTGRADAMLGNMKWAPARAKILAITDAIYFGGTYISMNSNNTVGKLSISDLRGHSVGALTAFSIVPELKKLPGLRELKLYDTTDGCVRDVMAERVDFAVLDAPTIDYMLLRNPGWNLRQVPLLYDAEFPLLTARRPSAIGLSQSNPDLFDAVNDGVKWLWRTGLNGKLLAKYGVANPDYLVPADPDPRIGVDRDASGNLIGAGGHAPKDYSALFA